MEPCTSKLMQLASAPICSCTPVPRDREHGVPEALLRFLSRRNGFYAFESALHVLPHCDHVIHTNVSDWNSPETWKGRYDGVLDDCVCFAEDIFGEQFASRANAVVAFNPESGAIRVIAASIEEWACAILTEYELLTGFPFAHEWQARFGPLRPGERLLPKMPLIFGGEYAVGNLYVGDATEGMRARADTYRQIRDLPDGAKVNIILR